MRVLGTLLPSGDPHASKSKQNHVRVRVSDVRERVLRPGCNGENDEALRVCQWYPRPSAVNRTITKATTLSIHKRSIDARYTKFTIVMADRVLAKRRDAAAERFCHFFTSRNVGGGVRIRCRSAHRRRIFLVLARVTLKTASHNGFLRRLHGSGHVGSVFVFHGTLCASE